MNPKLIKKIIFVACFLLSVGYVQAKIVLPSILNSGMVLQQQTQVKLWGQANHKASVKIITSWNKKVYIITADEKGNWETKISTPVAGGPYKISIADNEELVLNNILIGEVWFCSGQSNMEMPMKGFNRQPLKGTNDIIARANPKTPIRMFSADFKEGKLLQQYSKQPQTD